MTRIAPVLLLLACVGCADDPIPNCVPDEAMWNAEVKQLVAVRCGDCHGAEVDNGAPFSLIDYEALILGEEGLRIVDQMTHALADGAMPPLGFPQPSVVESDAIARWSSCNQVGVTDQSGLGSNRPIFKAPEELPTEFDELDITASEEAVTLRDIDRYHDVDFVNPLSEDVFIRRISAIVDDSRVLHHLVLARDNDSDNASDVNYLYTWAPGTGDIEFPGGGIRLKPGDKLELQIHYNNSAGHEDVRDSSGVRLWTSPPEGKEYDLVGPGPGAFGFSIPPREERMVEQTCVVSEDVTVLAAMPHMHETGTAFEVDIKRLDGTVDRVLELSSWDFEAQFFYDLPLEVKAGEEFTVRCHFTNAGDTRVMAGPNTGDEMCFAFSYVTPVTDVFCNADNNSVTDLEYSPGQCIAAPLDGITPLPAVHVTAEEGPTFDEEISIPDGRWKLSEAYIASTMGIVRLATFKSAGQAMTNAGNIELDVATHIVAPVDGARNGVQLDFTFSGALDSTSGGSLVTTTCPSPSASEGWLIGSVNGKLAARLSLENTVEDTFNWMLFEQVD